MHGRAGGQDMYFGAHGGNGPSRRGWRWWMEGVGVFGGHNAS